MLDHPTEQSGLIVNPPFQLSADHDLHISDKKVIIPNYMYFLPTCGPFLVQPVRLVDNPECSHVWNTSEWLFFVNSDAAERKKTKLEQSMEQNFKHCDFKIMWSIWCVFEPTCAICTMGSYASLSVCCLSRLDQKLTGPKIVENNS